MGFTLASFELQWWELFSDSFAFLCCPSEGYGFITEWILANYGYVVKCWKVNNSDSTINSVYLLSSCHDENLMEDLINRFMAVYLGQNKVNEQQIYAEISLLLFCLRKEENKLADGYVIFSESLGDFPQSPQSQEGVEHSATKQDHLSDKPRSGRRTAHEKFKHNREIYHALSSVYPNKPLHHHYHHHLRDLLKRASVCLIWNFIWLTFTGNEHVGERTTVPQWYFSKLCLGLWNIRHWPCQI